MNAPDRFTGNCSLVALCGGRYLITNPVHSALAEMQAKLTAILCAYSEVTIAK